MAYAKIRLFYFAMKGVKFWCFDPPFFQSHFVYASDMEKSARYKQSIYHVCTAAGTGKFADN